MPEKEVVFSMLDLRYPTIQCETCGTQVCLDLSSAYKPPAVVNPKFAPETCPTCGMSFDSAIPENLDKFKAVYEALSKLKQRVTFRAGTSVEATKDRRL